MKKTILSTITFLCGLGLANAGTISVSAPFTDDASTGISSTNTYTHAVSGANAAMVNGVNFDALTDTVTPANFAWSAGGLNQSFLAGNNGDWVPATGGVTGAGTQALLQGFTFSNDGAGAPASQTYSLLGLTVGEQYDARLYIRVWDTDGTGRPLDLSFTHGPESDSAGTVPEDRPSLALGGGNDHQAYYVSYAFTAMATQLDITAAVNAAGGPNSGSAHFYGLSNQVIPEPSSMGLLGITLFGLLRRRR